MEAKKFDEFVRRLKKDFLVKEYKDFTELVDKLVKEFKDDGN